MQTPTSSPTTKRAFLHACSQAKYPLALAGAGLSSASGIPTFRGAGGLWREHDPLSLATPGAFRADPSKVWQFYHYRRELCLRAQPNRAHRVLGWLNGSEGEGSRRVFPSARHKGLRLITQNVDGLSRRVGGGGREPLEMHGSLFETICTSCGTRSANFDSPICESLRGTEVTATATPLKKIATADLPRCTRSPHCGGLLRPGVVWFGESIPLLDEIEQLVAQCDLLLVLGTSSTVYPAAGFAGRVLAQGGSVAVFNIDGNDEGGAVDDPSRCFYFEGPVEDTLAYAVDYNSEDAGA